MKRRRTRPSSLPSSGPQAPPAPPRAGGHDLPSERFPLLFALVVLLALGARLWGLTREGFFIDEIRQAASYAGTLGDAAAGAAFQSVPPLDYWLGHLVSLLDGGDFALRLPALLFGVGSTALLTLVARRVASPAFALLAGALFALLPFPVYLSQIIRPYSSATFFFLALLLSCSVILGGRRSSGAFLLAAAGAFLFLLTRTDGPLLLTSLLAGITAAHLWAEGKGHRREAVFFLGAMGAAAAAALPFLLGVMRAGGGKFVGGKGAGEALTGITPAPLLRAFLVQLDLAGLLLAPFLVAGLYISLRPRGSASPAFRAAGALLLAAPLVHLAIYQARVSLSLQPGYLFYLGPLALIVSAGGLTGAREAAGGRWGKTAAASAAAMIPLLPALALVSLIFFCLGPPVFEDWKGTCRELRGLPADHVILFDGVVPFQEYEHAFWGFPRYFLGRKESFSRAEADSLLRRAPVNWKNRALLKSPGFLMPYLRKGHLDLEVPCPPFIEPAGTGAKVGSMDPARHPTYLQELGWLASLPGGEANRLSHLAMLPFHRIGPLSSAVPVLVLQWVPANPLTPWSPFPFREGAVPRWGGIEALARDPAVVLSSRSGFFLVRPARPSGDMKADLLVLLTKVLPFYPRNSSRIDPLLALLWLEKGAGKDTLAERSRQMEEVGMADGADPGEVYGAIDLVGR